MSVADLFHREYHGKMPYPKACEIICQGLEGVSYLNDKGFVHRDMKPENIFLRKDEDGRFIAKVGDFGLSRSYVFHGGTITQEGEWAGTAAYCSPEQILHFKDVTPRCDVYSMGISLYLLISGEFPYDFPTRERFLEMLSRGERPRDHIQIILGDEKPVAIQKKVRGLPKPFAAAVNKAIDKEPSRRFATAREFQEAIERYRA
jgi:eukaryotic-like serine/threonine-protein kinase